MDSQQRTDTLRARRSEHSILHLMRTLAKFVVDRQLSFTELTDYTLSSSWYRTKRVQPRYLE
jgi:hypothetical protein